MPAPTTTDHIRTEPIPTEPIPTVPAAAADPALKSFVSTRLLFARLDDAAALDALGFLADDAGAHTAPESPSELDGVLI